MSYSLNSLKGGLYRGLLLGVIKGDTRSLDSSSYVTFFLFWSRHSFRVHGLRRNPCPVIIREILTVAHMIPHVGIHNL